MSTKKEDWAVEDDEQANLEIGAAATSEFERLKKRLKEEELKCKELISKTASLPTPTDTEAPSPSNSSS